MPIVDANQLDIPLNNFSATAAPTATDDTSAGYSVGSNWYDTTGDKAYVMLDASAGAAVWTETTQSGGGGTNAPSTAGSALTSGSTIPDTAVGNPRHVATTDLAINCSVNGGFLYVYNYNNSDAKRLTNTDVGAPSSFVSGCYLNGFFYAALSDQTIYRIDIVAETSVAMTGITGSPAFSYFRMTTDGTDIYMNGGAGSTNGIRHYTVSGTTATLQSTTTYGATADFNSAFAVGSNGKVFSLNGGVTKIFNKGTTALEKTYQNLGFNPTGFLTIAGEVCWSITGGTGLQTLMGVPQ